MCCCTSATSSISCPASLVVLRRAVAHGLAMVDNIRGADFNGRFLLLALRTGEPRRLLHHRGRELAS